MTDRPAPEHFTPPMRAHLAGLVAELRARSGAVTMADHSTLVSATELGEAARQAKAAGDIKLYARLVRGSEDASKAARAALTSARLQGARAFTGKTDDHAKAANDAAAAAHQEAATRDYHIAHPSGLTRDGRPLAPRPTDADWRILLDGTDDELADWQAGRDLLQ